MIVEYDAQLRPFHAIGHYPKGTGEWMQSQGMTFIEIDETMGLDEVELFRENGEVVCRRRQHLSIDALATMRVGVETIITGIPKGLQIAINGVIQGEMDESGELALTPQRAGFYTITFSGSAWVTKEVRLEALP